MSKTVTNSPRILLVDGDPLEAEMLKADLESIGCEVTICLEGQLEPCLAESTWDAILADQASAPIEAFEHVLAAPAAPVLVVMAGFASIDDALEAVRAGAADFLSKPVSSDQVRVSLERALERRTLRAENRRLRSEVGERFELGKLESRSERMHQIFEMVRNVADTRATILIEGESGTGKTMLARTIHAHSSRAGQPFVEVNCGALPDALLESELFGHERGAFTGADKARQGKFEAADGGTIFLDEIACASLDLQVKLLRVLQDREFERLGSNTTLRVDVRVVAASNRALQEEVAVGRFREDLYYRLNVLDLQVPALRERRGDIVQLAESFLAKTAGTYERDVHGFEPSAMAALTAYPWPGNIRELENSIERAVLLSHATLVGLEALPRAIVEHTQRTGPASESATSLPLRLEGRTLKQAMETAERSLVLQALQENHGNRNRTAHQLGINRTTLFNKMTRFDLMDLGFDSPAGKSEGPLPR